MKPEDDSRAVRAVWDGEVIAESDDTVYLEGNHYFPPESLDRRFLAPSRLRTLCPWKGIAGYYSLESGGKRAASAAWTYRHPFPWIRKIRGHVAFGEAVEIVHGEDVLPRR